MMARLFNTIAALGCAHLIGLAGLGSALANDSYAILSSGGLQLVRNDKIRMLREDLEIAVDRIRVRYVFRNEAAAEEKIRVAFPLPIVNGGDYANIPIDLPIDGEPNFVGFEASADGSPLKLELEEKAYLEGKDVTADLRRLGFLINPMPFVKNNVLCRKGDEQCVGIEAEKRTEAVKLGLIYDDGTPAWDYAATFHWEQTFPSGKDMIVEHSYRPIAGSAVGEADYCIDPSTQKAIAAAWAHRKPEDLAYARRAVHYILVTARNWAGPIGEFHLTLRKPSAGSIISACVSDLRETGSLTYEWTQRDFTPERDLKVLFVPEPNRRRD